MLIKLKIITPSGIFIDDKEVNSVGIQTVDGDMTILANHSPIVSTLKIGTVTIIDNGQKIFVHVHRGIVKVSGERIKILTEKVYLVDENKNKIETPTNI